MNLRKGYIYIIINHINGKYYYGKTFYIERRWQSHLLNASKKINRRLYDAMNYYGYENFSVHKIKEIYLPADNIAKELNRLEIYFINLSESLNPKYGYNMINGGDGGDTLTNNPNKQFIIKKRTNSNKGKKRSFEICQKFSEIQINIHSSLSQEEENERGRKIADSRIKRIEISGFSKKEILAQISNAERLSDYNRSDIGKFTLSKLLKGKPKPPFTKSHRDNIGKASAGRKIPGRKIFIENKEYESLHEAFRILNIPLMTIRNRLINKNFPDWIYLDK
jgi:group I intron endonuclease